MTRGTAVFKLFGALAILFAVAAEARGQTPGAPPDAPPVPPKRGELHGRVTLSAMMLVENQDTANIQDASPTNLGYGDLRFVLQGRRFTGGLEFKADFRLRVTGNFGRDDALVGNLPTTARGYTGGREYDLRELWMGRRGDKVDFAVGRLLVREADAIKLDGGRLWWRFSPTWQASLFGGLYPNPFSRSLLDDYVDTSALAGGAGGNLAYHHARGWGSASLAGTFFGGTDSGGRIDPALPAGTPTTQAARVYMTWTNYLRVAEWLNLFHDLVVDLAGPVGVQVSRGNALAMFQAGQRLTVTLGYDHLSSFAVDMFLLGLLADRRTYLPGTVENNLLVERTARDEGRARADVVAVGRFHVYGEGRVRRRALVDPGADPHFAMVQPLTGWEATLGVRSVGDLAGLRLGAAFSYLGDLRAQTMLVTVDAGRDFWRERISLDGGFIWEGIRDAGAGQTACITSMPLAIGCYGRKSGNVYQAGLTLAIRPTWRWLALVDYRLVVATTDPSAAIVTHVLFARGEFQF